MGNVLASLNKSQSEEVEKLKKHKKKKSKERDDDDSNNSLTSGTSFRHVFRKRELKNKDISSMKSKDIALILGTAAYSSSPRSKKRKIVDDQDDGEGTVNDSVDDVKKEKREKKKR